MGTRAIIRFFDSESATEPFAAMYEQCDGYPDGLGAQLQQIDAPHTHGLSASDGLGSNGMPCFAATVVAKLKRAAYSTYLSDPSQPVGPGGYTYDLRPSSERRGQVMCRLWSYDGKTIEYDGRLRDAPWTKKPTQAAVQAHEAVRAYGKLWQLLSTLQNEDRRMTDSEAAWFYTLQPESVWGALREAGLDPSKDVGNG